MLPTPSISIIIPTFNRSGLIGMTLESIIAQTFDNWECIVVDDGSTDETHSTIEEFILRDSRISYYKRPDHLPKGANSCRNFGLSLSKGKFINWFDSDDLMVDRKLEMQVKVLEALPEIPMCVCQTMIFEGHPSNQLGLRKPVRSSQPLDDYICQKIKWLTQAPLIRRDFIVRHNLSFDETLHQSQEWDFFVRLLAINSRYEVIDEPLVLFRKHGASISSEGKTAVKILSNLNARVKLFAIRDRISPDSILEIRKTALSCYEALLQHGFWPEAAIVKRKLYGRDFAFSPISLLKIQLAHFSFRLFGKGTVFLRSKHQFH